MMAQRESWGQGSQVCQFEITVKGHIRYYQWEGGRKFHADSLYMQFAHFGKSGRKEEACALSASSSLNSSQQSFSLRLI
ncbi:unnamed protein product [Victoria cruziana]